jgi:hypothetical protein
VSQLHLEGWRRTTGAVTRIHARRCGLFVFCRKFCTTVMSSLHARIMNRLSRCGRGELRTPASLFTVSEASVRPVANDVCDEELDCTVEPNRCRENSSRKRRSSDSPRGMRHVGNGAGQRESKGHSLSAHWERSAHGSSRQYLPSYPNENTQLSRLI